MCAVRVEEGAGQIDNRLASPVQDEARLRRDHSDRRRLEIFFLRVPQEGIDILRVEHAGHALLRLGNRNFRAVEPRVLERHLVEVHGETRCELADCDRDAARAEVIALLD